MQLERTLVILKPDAVARRFVGKIISRLEEKGLRICAMRLEDVSLEVAEKHYAEHKAKPFFSQLTAFITSGPVVLMALEGVDAVAVVRKITGATLGRVAEPGSIRGDYGVSQAFNLIHASDSLASAERELALYFKEKDYIRPATEKELAWNYEFANGKVN
ncbi:MAG: nucleoside-diphosphate kinase [Planctomycetota bacterium]|jgi:nucleoside-diphosphate kinase|nr:nucleoside-diphosphate kinase [Planctomycetota bacterium]